MVSLVPRESLEILVQRVMVVPLDLLEPLVPLDLRYSHILNIKLLLLYIAAIVQVYYYYTFTS